MFNTSTQKSKWLFKDVNELIDHRKKANESFVKQQTNNLNYLSYEEEKIILIHYVKMPRKIEIQKQFSSFLYIYIYF